MIGLSAAQVAERVSSGRTNEYRERTSRSAAQILRANVFTIFNGILGVALVLVLALGHWADALFGFVLLLNTATGTLTEIRAKRALDRLSVLETPRAVVVRDGTETEVAVGEVVLDDVVRLRAGQQVPADGEVLTSDGLEIDESILTGESRPVRPVSGAQVMSGTTVTAGTGLFRTTAVGGDAYAHRLAREARRYSLVVSELQAGTNRVLHWISWVIVPVALVLVWSQLRLSGSIAEAWSSGAWRNAVVAGIAGVVSMVPQGLVLLTSVNFATASLSLARRNVLVQELPAVEVLARVDTLCLDKTGTITTGRIRLGEIQGADGGRASCEVLSALALLSTVGEPNATADAIREGLSDPERLGEHGLREVPEPGEAAFSTDVESVPFSSRRKWSAARDRSGTTWVLGAPEILLAGHSESVLDRARQIAAQGARVVALARSRSPWRLIPGGEEEPRLPDDLEAAGIVILTEEIRPDAAETLAYFRRQGVDGEAPLPVGAAPVAPQRVDEGEDGLRVAGGVVHPPPVSAGSAPEDGAGETVRPVAEQQLVVLGAPVRVGHREDLGADRGPAPARWDEPVQRADGHRLGAAVLAREPARSPRVGPPRIGPQLTHHHHPPEVPRAGARRSPTAADGA